jgi:hypothetical protein
MAQGLAQMIKHIAFLRGRSDSGSHYAVEAAEATTVAVATPQPDGGVR